MGAQNSAARSEDKAGIPKVKVQGFPFRSQVEARGFPELGVPLRGSYEKELPHFEVFLGSPYVGKLPICVQYQVRPKFFSGLGAWAFGAWWEGRMLGLEPYSLIRPGSLLTIPKKPSKDLQNHNSYLGPKSALNNGLYCYY